MPGNTAKCIILDTFFDGFFIGNWAFCRFRPEPRVVWIQVERRQWYRYWRELIDVHIMSNPLISELTTE